MNPLGAKVDRRQNDYTEHSRAYDRKRFRGRRNEYLEHVRRNAFVRALGSPPATARVLDVGCGTGRGLRYLSAARVQRIVGVDFTPAMLQQAGAVAASVAPGAQLVRGDAFRLPVRDATVDIVISLNFLHMFRLDLQAEIVGEMVRVCRPGGRLVVELESIHKGLFFSRYPEQRRLKDRSKFNSYREVARLFPRGTFRHVRVFGTAIPVASRWLCHAPRLGTRIEQIVWRWPFNWLSERILVSAALAR